MDELNREIKEVELQAIEIRQSREKLAELKTKYDKSKMTLGEQTREIKTLKDRIKTLEKELSLDKAFAEIKRILWTKID